MTTVLPKNPKHQIPSTKSQAIGIWDFGFGISRPAGRSGFTLLEVLLASIIALLLMAGLYTAMDVQLRYAHTGREAVDQSMLVRQIFARLSADLSGAMTPLTATPSATSSTPSSSSGGTTAATGGTATTTDPNATDPSTLAGTPATTTSGVTPFGGGLIGDASMVTVWISRLPQAPGPADPNVDAQETGGISDVRRVTYWWDGNGLVKKEISNVTADDDTTALPPASGDLIAAEVTNLTFEYFDGTNWVDTWDGTVLGDDGATPVGPPRAIRINIDVRYPSDPDNVKHYSKVVAINAGNAQPVAATTTGAGG